MNANPRDDADPNEIHRVIMFGFFGGNPAFSFSSTLPAGNTVINEKSLDKMGIRSYS